MIAAAMGDSYEDFTAAVGLASLAYHCQVLSSEAISRAFGLNTLCSPLAYGMS